MSDRIEPTEMPARMRDVLAKIQGSEHGSRFGLLFFAATHAMEVLRDLDFTEYEIDEFVDTEGLWDVLAPAVEDTTNSIAAFLECVRSLLGVTVHEPNAVDEELDSWLEALDSREAEVPNAATDGPEQQLEEVTALLRAISDGLTHELGCFRKEVDELRVQPDRWLLLDHIAMFRGKVRSGIGAMVYRTARLFLDVTREEIVPAYPDDVYNAIRLRRELARLRDELQLYQAAVQRTHDAAARRALIEGVEAELNAFYGSPAYRLVRAADKRPFGNVRRDLRALLESETLEHERALTFLEGLTHFLESMSVINGREILMLHDASEIIRVKGLLAAARAGAQMHDGETAVEAIRKVLDRCVRLYGRDESLDAVCRVLEHVQPDHLTPPEIIAIVRLLEDAL